MMSDPEYEEECRKKSTQWYQLQPSEIAVSLERKEYLIRNGYCSEEDFITIEDYEKLQKKRGLSE